MIRKIQKNSSRITVHKGKKIIIILMSLLILIVIFLFGFRITNVNVIGCDYYTKEQIEKKVIVDEIDNYSLLLFLKNKYFQNISIPFVQKIEIEVENRNTVTIHVYEKVMIGCIEYMGQILYFDKDGYIVESSTRKIDYVPYIVGLQYDKLVLHEKIEIQKEELFQTILNLTQLIRKYELPIEKISFNPNSEVTLIKSDIRVLLGKHKLYDEQMANLKNILPKADGLSGELDMTDFNQEDKLLIFKPDES